jgi:VCBS repeat-containing protein
MFRWLPLVLLTLGFGVAARAAAPTLTMVSDLTGATEDTPFTITYAALAAAANENDADMDAISFRVEAVTTGTLTKGGSPVVPGTTLLAVGESLVWTPPGTNTNGTIAAFTIVAFDGTMVSAAPETVDIVVAPANDLPTLTGTIVTATPDNVSTQLFATLVIADVDHGAPTNQNQTVIARIGTGVSTPIASFSGGAFAVTNTGTPAAMTTTLQALTFVPTANRLAPGGTETVTVTVIVTDSEGGSVTNSATVTITSVNDVPAVTGGLSPATMFDNQEVQPFTITLADPDVGETFTARLEFVDAGLAALATLSPAPPFTGSAASVISQVQNVRVRAVPNAGLTNTPVAFRLRVSDAYGAEVSVTNTLTIQIQNDAPDIVGVPVDLVRIRSDQLGSPFSTITIVDVDGGGLQPVHFTVRAAAAGVGRYLYQGNYSNSISITLSNLTPAAASTALRSIQFEPSVENLVIGEVTNLVFTITVTDVAGGQRVNNGTTLSITRVNGAPRWTGAPATQPILFPPGAPVTPFAHTNSTSTNNLALVDDDTAVTVTLTVDNPAKGAFTNLAGTGFVTNSPGVFQLTDTPANITTKLRGLVFALSSTFQFPATAPGGVTFTVAAEDPNLQRATTNISILVQGEPRNYLVTRTEDDFQPGSLRHALTNASNDGVITFALASYPALIRLQGSNGPVVLTRNVTIVGPGADLLTLSGDSDGNGSADMQLLRVESRATIAGLTFTKGNATGGTAVGVGGAISVGPTGDLILRFCAVTESEARFWGGGIDVDRGSLVLENCLLRGNSTDTGAGLGGGAVSLYTELACAIRNTTFSGNFQRSPSGFGGGALYAENFDPTADFNVQVTHCTFAGNTDAGSKGSSIHANVFGTMVYLKNSVVADGQGRNLQVGGAGRIISQGGNVSDDAATTTLIQGGVPQDIVFLNATGDLVSATGILGPLAELRGPVAVHPLLTNSPAIGRGVNPDTGTDQRGVLRDAAPDAGAFEFGAVTRIVINEVQAKDSPADFIELYLLRDSLPLNLAGYSVWVDGARKHVFPATPLLRPGFGIVVADTAAVTTPDPSTPVQVRSDAALNLGEQGTVEVRTPGGLVVARLTYLDRYVLPDAPSLITPFPGNSVSLAPQFLGAATLPHSLTSPLPLCGGRYVSGALNAGGSATSAGADAGGTPFGLPNGFPFAQADEFIVGEDALTTLPVLLNDLDADGTDRLVVFGVGSVSNPVPTSVSVATLRGGTVTVTPGATPLRGTGVVYDPRAPFAIQSLPAGAKLTDTFFYSMVDIGTGPISAYEGTLAASPTVVLSVSHRLVTGDKVVISGSGFAGYNGEHTVTRVDDDRFSIPVANGGDPAVKGSWITSDPRHPTATNAALATITLIGANDPPVPAADLVTTDEETILRIMGDAALAGSATAFETDPQFPLPRVISSVALLTNDDDVDTDDDFSTLKVIGVVSRTNAITGYAGTNGVSPVVVTSTNHGLANGAVILIANYGGHPSYNAYHTVTVINSNSFSIPVPFVDDHATKGLWVVLTDAGRLAATSLRGAAVALEIRADRTRTCVVYNPRTSSFLNGLAVGETDDDLFFYAAEDRHGAIGIAPVTVRVTGVNDVPRPQADPATLSQFTPLLGGSTLSNFVAQLGVVYALAPASGATNRADIRVTATNGAGAFVLTNIWRTEEDVALSIPAADLIVNDGDVDRTDALRVSAVSAASRLGAVLSLVAPGVRYDPAPSTNLHALARGEKRIDTFEITVTDDRGGSSNTLVAVLVVGKNDTPVLVNDLVSIRRDLVLAFDPITTINATVPARDLDPDVDGTAPDNKLALVPSSTATNLVSGVRILVTETNAIYDPTGASFFDRLGPGETYDDKFRYAVMDGSFVFAADDFFRVAADSATNVLEILANDRNLTGFGGTLRITSLGTPDQGGVVAIATNGTTITYTPEINFVGDEFFTYTITDTNGNTDTGLVQVRVTVNQLNGNLQARDDSFTVAVGESPVLNVLANDNILPALGSSLTITRIVTQPGQDSVVLSGNTITYVQNSNNVAPYVTTFVYEVSGGGTARATATATVRVVERRGALHTRADAFNVASDSQNNTLDVLANDHLLPGAVVPLTIRSVLVAPTNGSVTISAGGTRLSYTPATNFIGRDFLTYLATDSLGGTGTGAVQIAVGALTTANDFHAVQVGSANVLDVLANDRVLLGTAGTNISLLSVAPAASAVGTLALTATNTLLFTSTAGAGEQLFTYVITDGGGRFATGSVSVVVVAEGVKANADYFTVAAGSAGNELNVLANDVAIPDAGRPRSIIGIGTGVDAPNRGGTVTISAAGNRLVYTPDPAFSGEETFTYTMTDTRRSDTARVVVRVSAGTLTANDDAFTVFVPSPGGTFTLPVLANDRSLPEQGRTLNLTVAAFETASASATPGTVAINSDATALVFTPGTNTTYPYTERIAYEITDGTARRSVAVATIEVRLRTNLRDLETNEDRFAVEANSTGNVLRLLLNDDTKPAVATGWTITSVGTPTFGGVVIISGQNVLYTPRPNFVGTDVFTYSVSDGFGGTGASTVRVKVGDLQLNADQFVALSGRIAGELDVLANDGIRPALGAAYNLTGAGAPDRGGRVTFVGGKLYYVSDSAYAGAFPYTENFTYSVTNDSGETLTGAVAMTVHQAGSDRAEAEVTVRVVGINDPSTITGTLAGQRVARSDTIRPFAAVTISDVDNYGTQPLTVTVRVNQAAQGFIIPSGGFVDSGGGLYTLTAASPAAATTAVRGLIFVPTPASRVTELAAETTTFTITVNDGFGAPVQDANTSVTTAHEFRSKLVAPDGVPDDLFGTAVAVDRDTVVVGAAAATFSGVRTGVAYVFERDSARFDSWRMVRKLTPMGTFSVGVGGPTYGQAVAVHGDTIAVGAPTDRLGSVVPGAVYLYGRNVGGANNWGLVKRVVPDDVSSGQQYGGSLALAGDTLIVGSPQDDDRGANSGSIYVLGRNQGGAEAWGLVTKVLAPDGNNGDRFGGSVGLAGDTLVTGANGDDGIGSAYVFERNLGGTSAWGMARKLVPGDGAAQDQFGSAVAVFGDVIAVGSPLDDDLGSSTGSTYLFSRHVGGAQAWGQSGKLLAAGAVPGDQFGSAVAMRDGVLLIGAPKQDDRGVDAGAVYQFAASGAIWVQTNKFLPDGTSATGEFGLPVALDSSTVVVGARFDNDRGTKSGSISIFRLRDNNAPQVARPVASQAATNSQPFSLVLPADTFVDADVNDTLTLAASGPAWLAFNPAAAAFTGTPPLPGTNSVVLVATDREGLRATNTFVIVVADSGVPPAPAGPQPTLRALTTDPAFYQFTYQVNQGVTTSQAVLEMSSNLVTWTSAEPVMAASTVTPFDAASNTVTYYLPRASVSATNRFFFRVRISP